MLKLKGEGGKKTLPQHSSFIVNAQSVSFAEKPADFSPSRAEISPWLWYQSVFLSPSDYDNGEACVFPFTCKGKRFSACTKFYNLFGRFWWATTDSYHMDRQWVFCPD
ncbi:unnamed protein product [Eretmochelys imbricata]